MSHTLRSILAASVLVAAVVSSARAAEYFVDQKHASASDQNAGTEDKPLKTIPAAVKLAKPGDTIWVKAGQYEEAIRLETSGTLQHPITISAWKDDRVRIGSVLGDLPAADKWKPLPNSKSWAVQLDQEPPEDLVAIVDGKPIVTQRKDTPPDEKDDMWATYRKSDRTLMVSLTGKDNPASGHKLQLARNYEAIATGDNSFWNFKKLEFAWVNCAIVTYAAGYLIEDCYFHNTYRQGIFPHGRLTTIRRCNFNKCGYAICPSGSGPANIIEDNLIVDCGQDGDEDILHHSLHLQEGLGPLTFKGPAFAQIFRYNIIADTTGGLWYDGGETGCRVIGNCFWDIRHGSGIYNEYCANDTLIMGNYFLHTGVASSWCTRMQVVQNFFDGGTVVWHCRLLWPLRNSFMSMRGNALVDPPGGYLQHYGFAWGKSPYPEGFSNCWADYNRSRVRPEFPVLNDAGTKYKTLERGPREVRLGHPRPVQTVRPGPQRLDPRVDGRLDRDLPRTVGPPQLPGPPDAGGFGDQRHVPRGGGNRDDHLGAFVLLASGRRQLRRPDTAFVRARVRARVAMDAQFQLRLRPGREQRRGGTSTPRKSRRPSSTPRTSPRR